MLGTLSRLRNSVLQIGLVAIVVVMAAGLAKGSGVPNRDKVGKITQSQIREIVKMKLLDLNTADEKQAARQIAGTARSMGVDVVD